MWRPNDVGDVVAERRLLLRRPGTARRVVRVRFGRPVRPLRPRPGEPWCCPVEISGLGSPAVVSAPGEDSVQALVLALRLAEMELRTRARRARGQIDWLGDQERPILAHSFFLEMYEAALQNLVHGLKLALDMIEHPGRRLADGRLGIELSRLVERRGFSRAWTRRRTRRMGRR
jgi:hypothetical protein